VTTLRKGGQTGGSPDVSLRFRRYQFFAKAGRIQDAPTLWLKDFQRGRAKLPYGVGVMVNALVWK